MKRLDFDEKFKKYLEDITFAVKCGACSFNPKFLVERLEKCQRRGNKVIFIGNGGSAAICSHMAIDFTHAGGIRAICFNDGPLLTCLANDFGFENVFAKAIEMYASKNDILVAISSSGCSQDILNGAKTARQLGCYIITLSGFDSSNPLARLGDVNIYLPSSRPNYGKVEVAHYLILHFINDCLKSSRKSKPA